jgi:hypothetical protein
MNEENDIETTKNNNDAIKLSPTGLNLFLECPKCFWLEKVKGIKRPRGIFPSLPGGMDGILKVYFNEYRDSDGLPPMLEGKLEGKLMNPLPKTLFMKDDELMAVLLGKLDEALDFGDGTFAPVDHKTRGYAPKEEMIAAYQMQMDAYDLLLAKNGFPTRNKAYLLYYHPISGDLHNKFPFVLTIKEVQTNPERAMQVFRDAINLIRSSEMPQAANTCEYCAWAKTMEDID